MYHHCLCDLSETSKFVYLLFLDLRYIFKVSGKKMQLKIIEECSGGQQRSFEDLDGHPWEVLYIDLTKFPKQ